MSEILGNVKRLAGDWIELWEPGAAFYNPNQLRAVAFCDVCGAAVYCHSQCVAVRMKTGLYVEGG